MLIKKLTNEQDLSVILLKIIYLSGILLKAIPLSGILVILLKIIYLSGIYLRLLLGQVLLNRETRKLLVRLEDGLARLEQIYKAIIIICISLSSWSSSIDHHQLFIIIIIIIIMIRAQLEAIRPNSERLLASDNSGKVAGVILTLRLVIN